ncbi:hypothetical protein M8C21_021394 [Ambrosia artemisiifolia]|uniref:Histidine-containing phosphotransfer protein n=1 Tax=Ambrosia artemisiifolia TaxID=4212 RepID=A0AAD5GYX5_AMBAR|nr:hypothetical protein M8C21_021394 [Ambrosia artemisiifolia]
MDNLSIEASKRLLSGHVNSMYEESDVDDVFYGYRSPRSKCSADQLAEMIKSFCVEVEREISELEGYSKLPNIDFVMTSKLARSIKARSILIGAKNVRGSCVYVIEACLVSDEETLSYAVVGLHNVFKRTKTHFETYLENLFRIKFVVMDS